MFIKTLVVGDYAENCYIVKNEETNEALLVDPGAYPDTILREIENLNCDIKAILITHAHLDHIGAVIGVKQKFDVPVYIHKCELENMNNDNFVYRKLPQDICTLINDGDTLNIIGKDIKCIHTPGHSSGGVCFLIDDSIFTGDTLFKGAIGRTDLISGNYDTLINSIEDKLMILDKNIKVYSGHGEPSTIIYERMRNPYLQ